MLYTRTYRKYNTFIICEILGWLSGVWDVVGHWLVAQLSSKRTPQRWRATFRHHYGSKVVNMQQLELIFGSLLNDSTAEMDPTFSSPILPHLRTVYLILSPHIQSSTRWDTWNSYLRYRVATPALFYFFSSTAPAVFASSGKLSSGSTCRRCYWVTFPSQVVRWTTGTAAHSAPWVYIRLL
jgi:hypothetical protein